MAADSTEWVVPDEEASEHQLQERLKESFKRSPRYVRLVARMIRDDRVPVKARAALVLGGSYVVSPIDLVPGIIPVFGQLDDLIVVMAVISAATRLCPPELMDEHLLAVNLQSSDLTRDAETAKLAGQWAAAKGLEAARSVVGFGAKLTRNVAGRGYAMISERVSSR